MAKARTLRWYVGLLALFAALVLLPSIPAVEFYSLTGRFTPIRHVEALSGAVGVAGWDADGIRLADGRRTTLIGVSSLPLESAVIAEATRSGVEIDASGRVIGLVRIHHWCGNDPVREETRRVDLAKLVLYAHGDGAGGEPGWREFGHETAQEFDNFGWRCADHTSFFTWCNLRFGDPIPPPLVE